jgi:hypothetical protein
VFNQVELTQAAKRQKEKQEKQEEKEKFPKQASAADLARKALLIQAAKSTAKSPALKKHLGPSAMASRMRAKKGPMDRRSFGLLSASYLLSARDFLKNPLAKPVVGKARPTAQLIKSKPRYNPTGSSMGMAAATNPATLAFAAKNKNLPNLLRGAAATGAGSGIYGVLDHLLSKKSSLATTAAATVDAEKTVSPGKNLAKTKPAKNFSLVTPQNRVIANEWKPGHQFQGSYTKKAKHGVRELSRKIAANDLQVDDRGASQSSRSGSQTFGTDSQGTKQAKAAGSNVMAGGLLKYSLTRSPVGEGNFKIKEQPWSLQGSDAWPSNKDISAKKLDKTFPVKKEAFLGRMLNLGARSGARSGARAGARAGARQSASRMALPSTSRPLQSAPAVRPQAMGANLHRSLPNMSVPNPAAGTKPGLLSGIGNAAQQMRQRFISPVTNSKPYNYVFRNEGMLPQTIRGSLGGGTFGAAFGGATDVMSGQNPFSTDSNAARFGASGLLAGGAFGAGRGGFNKMMNKTPAKNVPFLGLAGTAATLPAASSLYGVADNLVDRAFNGFDTTGAVGAEMARQVKDQIGIDVADYVVKGPDGKKTIDMEGLLGSFESLPPETQSQFVEYLKQPENKGLRDTLVTMGFSVSEEGLQLAEQAGLVGGDGRVDSDKAFSMMGQMSQFGDQLPGPLKGIVQSFMGMHPMQQILTIGSVVALMVGGGSMLMGGGGGMGISAMAAGGLGLLLPMLMGGFGGGEQQAPQQQDPQQQVPQQPAYNPAYTEPVPEGLIDPNVRAPFVSHDAGNSQPQQAQGPGLLQRGLQMSSPAYNANRRLAGLLG